MQKNYLEIDDNIIEKRLLIITKKNSFFLAQGVYELQK